ncbi:MAG: preprotein translocase subunit SecE [Negativicutes bacterium]|nr:preprotein translocase subunit SecE [Negativicutes bacterium]
MKFVDRIKGWGKGITTFFRDVRSELRKVQWPGKKETVVYSVLVAVFTCFVSLLIWLIDSIFSTLMSFII